MDKFITLVKEAEIARNSITQQFEKVYYSNGDTSRLQRIFDKMTDRIIRRKSHVWLLEAALNFPKVTNE